MIKAGGLACTCCAGDGARRIAYILYPMDVPAALVQHLAEAYGTAVAVITGMDWDNDLTPWPAPGVPKGSPDFEGLAPEFLRRLTGTVVPAIDSALALPADAERSLVGVSLSGLFTLWQWAESNFFASIATLSGSYWYEGFAAWVQAQPFSGKSGHRCYMLLGADEPRAANSIFRRVGTCTEEIVGYLRRRGIDVTYETVPGNHYQHAQARLEKALAHLTAQ